MINDNLTFKLSDIVKLKNQCGFHIITDINYEEKKLTTCGNYKRDVVVYFSDVIDQYEKKKT